VPPCACFKKYLSEWRSEQEKKKEEFVKFIAKILENEEKMENLEKENESFKRNEEFAKKVAEMERERDEREKGLIKIPRELIGNIQLGKMNLVEGTSTTTRSNFIY